MPENGETGACMRLLRINHLGIAAPGLDEAMARMARLFELKPDHT